jgi:hypothetical protein
MSQLNAVQARKLPNGREFPTNLSRPSLMALVCTIFLTAVVSTNAVLHDASLSLISPSNQPTTGIERIADRAVLFVRVFRCLLSYSGRCIRVIDLGIEFELHSIQPFNQNDKNCLLVFFMGLTDFRVVQTCST